MTHVNIANTSRLLLTHSVEPQSLVVIVIQLKLLIVANLKKVVTTCEPSEPSANVVDVAVANFLKDVQNSQNSL